MTTATTDPTAVAGAWLEKLGVAAERADAAAAAALFLADGWWRDLLAFTWDLRSFHRRDAIATAFGDTLASAGASQFRLEPGKAVVLTDGDPASQWIQAFFVFETRIARGRGFVRLKSEAGEWRAWTVLTAMEELKGFEERVGPRRAKGTAHGEHKSRMNWLEERGDEREFIGRDPQVVVVGAGQAGLTIAARLTQLGVSTLIVEKNDRVGDNWRSRYRSLVLHDPVWYDHLPYMPFPAHWPVFTPKDKLAGWLESYVDALELNVWTKARLLGGDYDEGSGRWTLRVGRNGGERMLHPRHLVLATGMSGVPSVPSIPGAESFGGRLCHSSAHSGGDGYAGKTAVVVGCCNSGHDIAQDFYERGARVTIVQRSSTYVMSSENGIKVLFAGVYEEGGPPVEDADLMFASIPYPLLADMHRDATRTIADLDREMLDGLERAGFKLDYGDDGSGIFLKYLRRGGGYYIDVGCSRLIADGKIAVKQGVQIERFTANQVVFTDGSTLPADIVVLATGYKNMRESARALVGDKIADRLGLVWGLDEEGELRTMWRNSGHPGFWFMGGNLHQCRHYSKPLALQIKAALAGIRPYSSDRRDPPRRSTP
jgi:cation diffusion facilitator CzcD-associated flavoprotein CzcO